MTRPHRVRVDLHPEPADRGYDVAIERGVLARAGDEVRAALGAAPRSALLVRDTGVPDALAEACRGSLERAGLRVVTFEFTPSEKDKDARTFAAMLARALDARLERRDFVVALGGGITGDLAGFVAASYRRGVAVVQCPTTLLSMVDASVGGKTGINLASGSGELIKNMAGAFHQPARVLIDPDALKSLPDREFRAGLAECVKHALIAGGLDDAGLLEWTERVLSTRGPSANTHSNSCFADAYDDAIEELIARSVALKARVVAADERETAPASVGGRALLNLGHTFGHAIETLPGLSPDDDPAHAPLLHGEAVALGTAAAFHAAEAAGLIDRALVARACAMLDRAGLPTRVRGLPPSDEVLARMMHDKKVIGGELRLVLPVGAGVCRVIESGSFAGDLIGAARIGIDAIRRA
ncbi:MAG: 3-dehydroquinate synthase family protein [Phycisphaerales bacterium]|jgi:3-dehydroquinate synthetase|nr:3-dehydroquinate synthase family protein [Phycisphaerales bacterium]